MSVQYYDFYKKFSYKPENIFENGKRLQSDAEFLSMNIGTRICSDAGDEYIKTGHNVFDKVNRTTASVAEINKYLPKLNGDNTYNGINNFNGETKFFKRCTLLNADIQDTFSVGNTATLNIVTAQDISVQTKLTAPLIKISTADISSVNPPANNAGNIGLSSKRWATAYINNVYTQKTGTVGADLAEYYETDKKYAVGTVLEVSPSGKLTEYNGGALAGVVSENPGVIINADAPKSNYQLICLKGLVPVIYSGKIYPGQYCIAVNGGAVIGKNKANLLPTDNINIVGVCIKPLDTHICMVKV